jgi:DNA polymerase III alpha subunit
MQDPTRIINGAYVEQSIDFNDTIILEDNIPRLIQYVESKVSLSEFDELKQATWYMPTEYQTMDIAKYVLDKCTNEEELQRAGQELLMFQEREMFPLLCYLKYLVDTMRKHNVVWGVGRGSSVASYVLFLIGIHRINSLYYGLSIDEFLK